MPFMMEFFLLGPLLVRADGIALSVTPGKERAVLAALLLNANRIVSVDELAETLWGSAPPPSARVTIQNYVKRLRRALGEIGGTRISTHAGGYRVRVDRGELDVSRFEALLRTAQSAVRNAAWAEASASASAALALWRDKALADVDSVLLAQRYASRLTEMRLQATVSRIEADLHLGRQAEVIGELRQLIAAHPLSERQHALLMLALYSDGRPAEALAVYRQARRLLIDELGIEPGNELRQLHQQILSRNQALPDPGIKRLAVVGSAGGNGHGARIDFARRGGRRTLCRRDIV